MFWNDIHFMNLIYKECSLSVARITECSPSIIKVHMIKSGMLACTWPTSNLHETTSWFSDKQDLHFRQCSFFFIFFFNVLRCTLKDCNIKHIHGLVQAVFYLNFSWHPSECPFRRDLYKQHTQFLYDNKIFYPSEAWFYLSGMGGKVEHWQDYMVAPVH